ncbi:Predicted oxidoreductase, contains short-chain dehydrogenase (SDR) and DUF2520 domains [Propionispira arboris]|uniref:Predicted oxidoreductase, contains short-chain dehydrogenase (SDR) and DUF2520 domains n=1 Tax=Propionispira arboris TaxID=84035 RepID=A0A1H7BC18_9FIRM|nr:Rossmann-like and DUF2520 domain-containing protein [Propionispira arboris]SEJ73817.1 Predicted oxidoreductase, contains short-chain dehydrogenase (SDR) and DUF2520 domains [Propionispira arboris]
MNKVGIIGAGKVGSVLAIALQREGINVCAVSGGGSDSAKILADRIGILFCRDTALVAREVDIILIATPDREIKNVVNLLKISGEMRDGQIVFHVCGSQSAEILAGLRSFGVAVGSIHPLQSFSSIEAGLKNLGSSYFAIDGDEQALVKAKEFVGKLNGICMYVPPEDRALYHAAACMASNYLTALLHSTVTLMKTFGVDETKAIKALHPILQGTLTNIETYGTLQALTGPIVRGDVGTITQQLQQIDARVPSQAQLYRELGKYTLAMAKQRHTLAPEQIVELEQCFSHLG